MLPKEEVEKIAKLARLALTPEEIQTYQVRLGRVLEYVNELNSIKFEKLDFVQHVPTDAVPFRQDEPKPSGIQEHILKNSPQLLDNCFMLPPVVEHE